MANNEDYKPHYSVREMRKKLSGGGVSFADFSMQSLSGFVGGQERFPQQEFVAIVAVCSGRVRVGVGDEHFELHRNNIFIMNSSAATAEYSCSKACVGYVLTFSQHFLERADVDAQYEISTELLRRRRGVLTLSVRSAEALHRLVAMLADVSFDDIYARGVAESLFSAIFHQFLSSLTPDAAAIGSDGAGRRLRSERLFDDFRALLNENCVRERSVEYYAKRLGITPKYLSMICRAQVDSTASTLIEQAVIHRAKSMLLQPAVSVQEVAKLLNFASQSFFGKYFKQRVGLSPSRYRSCKI